MRKRKAKAQANAKPRKRSRAKPEPVVTAMCLACREAFPAEKLEAHEATERHKRRQERFDQFERDERIEDATIAAEALRKRGRTRCPRCQKEWLAPAAPEGGPLVPVQLDACPRCGAKNPDAVRADQKYQAELDAAHARIRLHGKRKMRRLAAAAWFDTMEAEGHPVAVRALDADAAAAVRRAREARERMK